MVAGELARSAGCTLEAPPAGLVMLGVGGGERERGRLGDAMVFALSSQVDGGEYVLRWKERRFRRCGRVLFWPSKF